MPEDRLRRDYPSLQLSYVREAESRHPATDEQPDVDAVITGEIHEWETSEYVRDAVCLGFKKGLIIAGHAASEEPGMKWIVPWLQERLPGIPIHFVPTENPFQQL